MNFDKKRKSRVQGGWASNASVNNNHKLGPQGLRLTPSTTTIRSSSHIGASQSSPSVIDIDYRNNYNGPTPSTSTSGSSSSQGNRHVNTGTRAISSYAKKNSKIGVPVMPFDVGKDIEHQPVQEQKFVYEEPEDGAIKWKPSDLVISNPGVYDISTEPSGVSRLRFFPGFIPHSQCDAIFAELSNQIPWRQKIETTFGGQETVTRLIAWFGDQPYRVRNRVAPPNNAEWPPSLKQLHKQVLELTGIEFNSFVASYYRNGHDSIGWHSDSVGILGRKPVIASFSFGQERTFELRKIPPPKENGDRGDFTYSQKIRIPMRSGTLLLMEGWIQADWQHRVPKERHDCGARINVTFRTVKSKNQWRCEEQNPRP